MTLEEFVVTWIEPYIGKRRMKGDATVLAINDLTRLSPKNWWDTYKAFYSRYYDGKKLKSLAVQIIGDLTKAQRKLL